MIRSTVRIVVLVLISAGVGVGYASYRGLPLFPDPGAENGHALWVQETGLSYERFVQHCELGELVIDARPRELFEAGHLDAPFVINIPADEAADGYHLERLTQYLGQQVVLYCASESCESAEILWRLMQASGFSSEVHIYHPGWKGIEAAGLPTVSGPDLFSDEFDLERDSDESGGD